MLRMPAGHAHSKAFPFRPFIKIFRFADAQQIGAKVLIKLVLLSEGKSGNFVLFYKQYGYYSYFMTDSDIVCE